ncbi:hypothetical protein [Mucilaginibacter flavidus]|uniref:hypothetical protein n=1 Tax=Mucilaginibacter flavidus TaxID=2949309 RepID=UPI002091E775|nr:hypothetical protein [Mucilaginibacter flavidus]
MKLIQLSIIVLLASLLGSCGNKSQELTGAYVTQFKNEYSSATDTLLISVYSLPDKIYNVEYRAGFQKVRNGIVQPKEFKIKQWKATWNDEKMILEETGLGRQIQFISNKPVVLIGDMEYHKIK